MPGGGCSSTLFCVGLGNDVVGVKLTGGGRGLEVTAGAAGTLRCDALSSANATIATASANSAAIAASSFAVPLSRRRGGGGVIVGIGGSGDVKTMVDGRAPAAADAALSPDNAARMWLALANR